MPEIHDCCIFGDRSAERQTSKLAHRSDLEQHLCHGCIAQREPVLQQVNTQHGVQWVRLATTAGLWLMRLNQYHQTARRHHLFHFDQETLSTGLLALTDILQIAPTSSTSRRARHPPRSCSGSWWIVVPMEGRDWTNRATLPEGCTAWWARQPARQKTGFRGLAKNTAQLVTLLARSNPSIARTRY